MKKGYVYILASRKNGTLYAGVTNDLARRIDEHKTNVVEGFTKKYNCHLLVWYEVFDDIQIAIQKEKQLKTWRREWKLKIIEQGNPNWNDLSNEIEF